MKVMVLVKRVIDYNVRVRVKSDASGVETDGVKMSINPFDEIALEEALRLREAGHAEQVLVVSMGSDACQQQLRTALAMGADRAIQIATDAALQPLRAAQLIKALIEREQPGMVLLGKQAIDDDNNQTGQMLAALWQRPQATNAAQLEVQGDSVRVTREVDDGLQVLELDLPAVISTDLRLNTPRFVKLPDIMKAKKKPLDVVQASELGDADDSLDLHIDDWQAPPKRGGGIMVEDVDALVSELKSRGLV
ncbi:MAG: electron transfer flavoprotein subunit beta/FixA family protein [Gammaproteobacteria bacterium]|nr:electron transfer flavoprotein subunit beta/FixA family protein [Gammaproteobacteria bacterium]